MIHQKYYSILYHKSVAYFVGYSFLLVLFHTIIGCSNHSKEKKATVLTPEKDSVAVVSTNDLDTLYVKEQAVIIHYAIATEIVQWRKDNEGGFEESIADNLHYLDETTAAVQKLKLPIITTKASTIAFVQNNHTTTIWQRSKHYEGWGAIAFLPNKPPKKIDITNASAALQHYLQY